jgi:hypothetical protein
MMRVKLLPDYYSAVIIYLLIFNFNIGNYLIMHMGEHSYKQSGRMDAIRLVCIRLQANDQGLLADKPVSGIPLILKQWFPSVKSNLLMVDNNRFPLTSYSLW